MSQLVLVAGATGGVGRHIVRKLLEREYSVRALVRDVEKARQVLGAEVELAGGDVRQSEALSPAMEGVHLVICAIGSSAPVGGNRPKKVDYEGVRNLVEAAKVAGVEHFVLVSSASVTRPNNPLNLFGRVLTWKFRGEESLRDSGLSYTIVRPGGLTDGPGGQKALRFDQGDRVTGMISREDVAKVCVQAVEQPGARKVTFEVIESDGPASADWAALFAGLRPDG